MMRVCYSAQSAYYHGVALKRKYSRVNYVLAAIWYGSR